MCVCVCVCVSISLSLYIYIYILPVKRIKYFFSSKSIIFYETSKGLQ